MYLFTVRSLHLAPHWSVAADRRLLQPIASHRWAWGGGAYICATPLPQSPPLRLSCSSSFVLFVVSQMPPVQPNTHTHTHTHTHTAEAYVMIWGYVKLNISGFKSSLSFFRSNVILKLRWYWFVMILISFSPHLLFSHFSFQRGSFLGCTSLKHTHTHTHTHTN